MTVNATKRKFQNLLNGLGNKSRPTTPSSDESMPPPATPHTQARDSYDSVSKRRRVFQPFQAAASISTVPSSLESTTTTSSSRQRNQGSVISEESAPSTGAPTFAPWDRDAFLARLQTFATLTDWSSKPERVNEVEWAKRGWVCGKMERVRCCSCNVELLVKLNKNVKEDGTEEPIYVASNINVEEQLVNKYAELIITGHAEECLWRARGCDETIFKLPLNDPNKTIPAIQERYKSLAALGDALPYSSDMHTPENFDLKTVLRYLPTDLFPTQSTDPNNPQPEINKVAITMAIFGWTALPKSTHSAASCSACFRRLGLWLFKSKEVSATTGESIIGAAMNHLDPAQEHRDYCPWKNAESQCGASSKDKHVAWEIVLRALKNEYLSRHPEESRKKVVNRERAATDAAVVGVFMDVDEESLKEAKAKDLKGRIRRVKSLFNTKDRKKKEASRMSAPHPPKSSHGPVVNTTQVSY